MAPRRPRRPRPSPRPPLAIDPHALSSALSTLHSVSSSPLPPSAPPVALLTYLATTSAFHSAPLRLAAAHVLALAPPTLSPGALIPPTAALVAAASAELPLDAPSLVLAFRAIVCIAEDVEKRRGKQDEADLRRAVEVAMPSFAEAIRCALFPSPTQRIAWGATASGGDESDSALSSSALSAAESESGPHGRRSDLSSSRAGLSPVASRATQLRQSALDALAAVAGVAPGALVPYWGLYLPEREGVPRAGGGMVGRRETLANLVLYERNDAVRGAAVAVVGKLLSGSWRYMRGGGGNAGVGLGRPGFMSVGGRVVRVCCALYSVVASAVRKEASPGVLARMMRLATELCANATAPVIPIERVGGLVEVLVLRSKDVEGTDRTSRSAALACIATAVSKSGACFRAGRGGVDMPGLLDVCLRIVGVDSAPVAEALVVMEAVAGCEQLLMWERWDKISACLKALLVKAEDDQVLRLHVMRALQAMLTGSVVPGGERERGDSLLVEFAVSTHMQDVWVSFLVPAMSDSFHAVRMCGVRCTQYLLALDDGVCAGQIVKALASKLGGDGSEEKSSAVKLAVIKALSVTRYNAASPGTWHDACAAAVEFCCRNSPHSDSMAKSLLATSTLVDMCTAYPSPEEKTSERTSLPLLCGTYFHAARAASLPSGESSEAAAKGAGVESCQASGIWSLGSCASALLRGVPFVDEERENGPSTIDAADGLTEVFEIASAFAAGEVIFGSTCYVGSGRAKSNACRVLGRLFSELRADSIVATSLPIDWPLFDKGAEALCSAAMLGDMVKVQISAADALLVAVDPQRLLVSQKPLSAIFRTSLSVLSTQFDGEPVSPDAEHSKGSISQNVTGGSGDRLAQGLSGTFSKLLCSVLQGLEESSYAAIGCSMDLGQWGLLLNVLMREASLPAFAMRALEPWDGTSEEEYLAAVDSWKSLDARMTGAFESGARLARHAVGTGIDVSRMVSVELQLPKLRCKV